MDTVRILLVDDHRVMRQGVRALLELQPGFEVVGEAGTGADGIAAVLALRPDVLVLDLRLPDLPGTEVCRRVLAELPDLSVLVLTAISDGPDVLDCVDAGAKGYLLKDVDVTELARTIRHVHAGESVLDPKVTRAVLDRARSAAHEGDPSALTEQERVITGLIAEGLTNKEIGERLYMSASAVKIHISDIMQKLDVRRRAQVVFRAAEEHLI